MIPARFLAIGAVLAVAVAVGWWVQGLRAEGDALRLEIAAQAREIAAQEQVIAQARLAREVAEAEAARQRKKAAEYDALRSALIEGNEDAPIPVWLRAYLDGVLRLPAPR